MVQPLETTVQSPEYGERDDSPQDPAGMADGYRMTDLAEMKRTEQDLARHRLHRTLAEDEKEATKSHAPQVEAVTAHHLESHNRHEAVGNAGQPAQAP